MNIEDIQQRIINGNQLQIIGNANNKTTTEINIIDMSKYSGVVEYHPEELVITVKAGTTIREIEHILDQQNQVLPFVIEDSAQMSIGGAYAIGNAELRDAVLGVKIIDGLGRLLSFGGQVMKNVAGYDVSRLLVGSQGKLAVICEISFKVIPKAYANQMVNLKPTVQSQNSSDVRRRIEQGLKMVFDPQAKFI